MKCCCQSHRCSTYLDCVSVDLLHFICSSSSYLLMALEFEEQRVSELTRYFYCHFSLSPKRVMFIGMICQIVCGILTGAIKIYWIHVLFRCLSAVSCALMYTSGTMICEWFCFSFVLNGILLTRFLCFQLVVDTTGGRAKIMITILFELFWSIGLILLPVFYVFITNPFGLYIGISTPTLLMVFLYRCAKSR